MSRNLEKQEAEQREEAARAAHAPHADHVRHRWITLVLWSVGGIAALLGLMVILGALTESSAAADGYRGDDIVVGAVLLLIGLACGFFAWLRRPARAHEAGRGASQPFHPSHVGPNRNPGPSPSPGPNSIPTVSPGTGTGRRHGRYRRRGFSARTSLIIFGVAFVICAVATPGAIGDAQRSTYTQKHGIASTGVAGDIDNAASCNKYGDDCSYTFSATVTFLRPIDGRTMTIVHGNNRFPDAPGASVTVLVDPHDPDYAEFAGNKLNLSESWLLFPIAMLVCALLAGWSLLKLLRQHPHWLPNRHLRRSLSAS